MRFHRCMSVLPALALLPSGACEAQEVATDLPNLPSNAVAVPFEQMKQVTNPIGGPVEPARRVIRDTATWVDFWSQLTRLRIPPGDPPSVDFSGNVVLVAAMGRRPTAGYRISIEGVYQSEGRLFVDVLEVSPGVGCLLAQMLTAPVTAVLVPAHDGPVEFMVRTQTEECR